MSIVKLTFTNFATIKLTRDFNWPNSNLLDSLGCMLSIFRLVHSLSDGRRIGSDGRYGPFRYYYHWSNRSILYFVTDVKLRVLVLYLFFFWFYISICLLLFLFYIVMLSYCLFSFISVAGRTIHLFASVCQYFSFNQNSFTAILFCSPSTSAFAFTCAAFLDYMYALCLSFFRVNECVKINLTIVWRHIVALKLIQINSIDHFQHKSLSFTQI